MGVEGGGILIRVFAHKLSLLSILFCSELWTSIHNDRNTYITKKMKWDKVQEWSK